MKRLRRGDTVQVLVGENRGKRGKVLRVDLGAHKVIVQGVNLVYKHIRRSQKYPQGGRIQKEAQISVSNVMLVDPELDHPVRVRAGVDKDGNRVRVSAKTGNPI